MTNKNKIKNAKNIQGTNASGRSEAELRYGAVFDQSPDGILIIDAEGKIIDFNKAAHTDLGYTREEFSRLSISDIDPLESPEEIRASIKRAMSEKKGEFEVTHRTRSGQYRNVLVITQTIVLSGITVLHAIWRDITEQKATDKKVRYLASILEHIPDAVSSIDTEGRIVSWNEGAERILGYKADEIIGRPVRTIIPEERAREEMEHCIGELNKEGAFAGHETVRIAKDGRRVRVEISGLALRDGQKITGYASIMRDITNRLSIEKALIESETKYRDLFENAGDAVFVLDSELRYVDVNRRGLELLGYTKEELLGRQPFDFIPEEQKPHSGSEFDKLRQTGSYEAFEGRMLAKDGGWIDIEINSTAIFRDGVFAGSRDIVRDITGRKRADAALREREKQLAESQRIAHIGSWEHNLTTGKVVWSDELFRLLGLDPRKDPADFNIFFDMIHPDDRTALKEAIDNTVRTGKHFSIDYRINLQDGRTRVLHAQAELRRDATGTQIILSGTGQDITERKRAEDALRESEELYRNLIETTAAAAWEVDLATLRFTYISPQITNISGFPPEQWTGFNFWAERIHPEDREYAVSFCNSETAKGLDHSFEYRMITADNRIIWIRDVVSIIRENGKPVSLRGYLFDITERRRAEEAIQQSETFIRSILDTVDEGFIVIDRDFRILIANKAYCSQVGESCDSVIGRHCYDTSHKTLRPCYEEGEECAVRQVFGTGEPHTALHKHPDAKGSILYVETKAFPIKDSTGAVTSVIETVNNITEKHLLEEEQLKTQKLEAIGTLAGGIAHDFNNLLQGVFGHISMAKMTLDQKERSLAMLEQAEKALHMSVNLTTQLLTFSKGGKPFKKKIPLQSIIENSVKFALSGSRIDSRIQVDEDLRIVEADGGQIGQVIQNLVLNAEQAMPIGGTILIKARNVGPRQKGFPPALQQGNYIEISIKDSGMGIPEQYLPRIFDPYFTTKDKGSGLGLATSYSIIKNHGGLIDVKSKPGEGTIFSVYLPAVEAAETLTVTVSDDVQALRRGRILLMDDEDIVRKIAGVMLRSLGHEVELVENGKEAIDKYRESMESGRRFDIVIMDLTIRGGMGGEEAIKVLLEIDPDIRTIVSSGYTDSSAISEYEALGFKACLTKPYDIVSLNSALNSLLD